MNNKCCSKYVLEYFCKISFDVISSSLEIYILEFLEMFSIDIPQFQIYSYENYVLHQILMTYNDICHSELRYRRIVLKNSKCFKLFLGTS